MGARSGGGGGAGGGGARVTSRTNIDSIVGQKLTASAHGEPVYLTVNKSRNGRYSIETVAGGKGKAYTGMLKTEAQSFFSGFMKLNTWRKS